VIGDNPGVAGAQIDEFADFCKPAVLPVDHTDGSNPLAIRFRGRTLELCVPKTDGLGTVVLMGVDYGFYGVSFRLPVQ